MNAWTLLLMAAALEIAWATGLKSTNGFTRLVPSVAVVAAIAGSLYLLSLATRTIPIGTAYASWSGIGAAGTALVAILWGSESANVWRVCCILLIVIGVVGLKYGEG